MSFADVAFNVLGLTCVATVLAAYRRHKSARTHVCLIGLAVIVLMAAAIGISSDGFGALRLFSWCLYVDLPLLLAGTAFLVRRDWPRTAIASAGEAGP